MIKSLLLPRFMIPLLTLFLVVNACGDQDNRDQVENVGEDKIVLALRQLEKEVIDVHDEVMPKMATLNNTRKKLLKKYDDPRLSSDERHVISTTVRNLEEADSLMWDWMHSYNRPDYNDHPDSIRAYLEKEKITVLYMKEIFLASMANGEDLITKYASDDK